MRSSQIRVDSPASEVEEKEKMQTDEGEGRVQGTQGLKSCSPSQGLPRIAGERQGRIPL